MAIGIEICAFIGAFIGVMIATLGPYYKTKKELGMDDVSIFFDKKFLKSTVVSGILSAVAVGGSFPIILENVNPSWSYLSTIVFSAVLAMTLNLGGNILLSPSEVTMNARRKLMTKNTAKVMSTQLDATVDKLRKSERNEPTHTGSECTCKKCNEEKQDTL
jgi:hypothetical protein